MESTLAKSPVETKKAMTPEEARRGLLDLVPLGIGYYSTPTPAHISFCSCCGSQYLDSQGRTNVNSVWVRPTREAIEAYYLKQYGDKAKERFRKSEWEDMVTSMNRQGLPGVTLANMKGEEALPILYEGKDLEIAEHYTINDKDHGTWSVLWVNK